MKPNEMIAYAGIAAGLIIAMTAVLALDLVWVGDVRQGTPITPLGDLATRSVIRKRADGYQARRIGEWCASTLRVPSSVARFRTPVGQGRKRRSTYE